jgi:hypothetical protein
MNTSASVKLTAQQQLDEILNVKTKSNTKTETKTTTNEFANVELNPFYVAIYNPELSPEEKIAAVEKLLTDTGSKETNRTNIKAYEEFKAYLHYVQEQMALKIIELSDTKNFSVLKQTIEDMNGDLLNFENGIKPLTDIIDGLYILRSNDQTVDAFREIKNEKQLEETFVLRETEINKKFEDTKNQVMTIEKEIASLSEQKDWFGRVKSDANALIAKKRIDRENALLSLTNIEDELNTLNSEKSATINNSQIDAQAKQGLRNLLDLSSDEHEKRSQFLKDSAINFVKTARERTTTINQHLGYMGNQIENLDDSNSKMNYIFAICNDGIKKAEVNNEKIREDVLNPKDNETTLDKLKREERKRELDEHTQFLQTTSVDTLATVSNLTSASIRIKNMKDATNQQVRMVSDMQTRGVSGVADRLSTVINAVGAAALAESAAMAGDTLNAMTDNTNSLVMKESMRIAMGINNENENILKIVADLENYGKVQQASTSIIKEGLAAQREHIEALEKMVNETAEGVKESYAAVADTISSRNDKPQGTIGVKKATDDPFSKLKVG